MYTLLMVYIFLLFYKNELIVSLSSFVKVDGIKLTCINLCLVGGHVANARVFRMR